MKATKSITAMLMALSFLVSACTDEITTIAVTSVELDTKTLSMTVGQKEILLATVYPEDADNQKVSWSSSDESVVTVTNGKVTAIAVGTATVTVKTNDGNHTASCAVTVTENAGGDNTLPDTPSQGEGEGETEKIGSVTITLERVTATKAVFKGSTKKTAPDIEVGIYWSRTQGTHINDCENVSTYKLTNGEFELVVEDLNAETEYYYYPYIFMNGQRELGDETSFKTAGPTFTLDNVEVDELTVTFTGYADHDCAVGIYCSTESPSAYSYKTHHWVDAEDNHYTLKLDKLSSNTTYYYCTYIDRYSNDKPTYGGVKTFTTRNPILTIDNVSVNENKVTFTGNAELDVEGGILYSVQPTITKADCLGVIDLSNKTESFTKTLALSLGVTYYYCTYYWNKATESDTYGDVKSFKTKDITLTIDNVSVNENEVTFTGNAELDVEGGILYSVKPTITKDDCLGVVDLSNKTTTFSEKVFLNMGTTYYYCTYYWSNVEQSYVYKEASAFKVADFQWDLSNNLSASETANCYIVSQSGFYKIKTVKGNSSTSVGSVASAEVLWESFGTSRTPTVGDLIKYTTYKDECIGFCIPDDFKEGNAVIAAKDANGKILWSWHIWLTDQPQEQVYNNDAGTMMDRNLGATSATAGDVGALGLLYQWGRKDPFLGSSSISKSVEAKSTITWSSRVGSNASTGTIEYATANPTTFITYNSRNYDWYYTGTSSTDNTRWTESDKTKSIYDPCPAGWRVPDGGSNGVWKKAGFDDTTYDSTNEGISFSISSPSTTWYPASGYRNLLDGSLSNVGNRGYYWSASPYSNYAYYLLFNYHGGVSPSYNYYRAYGQSVRCLQESK